MPGRGSVMRCLRVLLLIAAISVGAFAQGTAAEKPDARLDQKVTLEVSHVKLEDVCRQLTEMTGVTIKAGTGERDWKVRERKVTIYAKDVPLDRLVTEISKLLGFYVSKSGKEGEWTYTFWQDLKARQFEAEMLSAEKEAEAQRITRIREGAIDAASEALKLSPEEARKTKDTDPWLAYLGGTTNGRAYASMLQYIANMLPTERELMLRGLRISIPITDLPPNMQQVAKDMVGGGFMGFARNEKDPDSAGIFDNVEPFQITILPGLGFGASDREMGMMGLGGVLILNGKAPGMSEEAMAWMPDGFPAGMFPVTGGDSLLGNAFGQMLTALEDGATEEEIQKLMGSEEEQQKFVTEGLAKESKTEKEPPTDPELVREVELDELPKSADPLESGVDQVRVAGEVAEAISRAIGKPVLVESFIGNMPLQTYLTPGKHPVYKILVGLEKAGYTWTIGSGTLRVRPNDWAIQRSYEIPESLLAKYVSILERNGTLTLDDLTMIVTELSDAQIDNTLMKDKKLMLPMMTMQSILGHTRELLRFYGSLSSQQKAMLKSEAGLPFSSLSSQQWDRLGVMITSEFGGLYIVDGNIRMEQPRNQIGMLSEASVHIVKVTVIVGDEQQPRTFQEMIMTYDKATMAEMQKTVDEAEKKAKEESKQEEGTEPQPVETE